MDLPSQDSYTDPQLLLVNTSGSLYVEACPGAGKTRAIVGRYLRRTTDESRKGIALLSFTNAAVDEVRSRCGSHPDALVSPHFVGTFDTFINRFITSPLYVNDKRIAPRFVDAWNFYVRCRDLEAGQKFPLEWFTFGDNGEALLDDSQISGKWKRLLGKHVAVCRAELERQAARRFQWATSGGLFSSSASRHFASSKLKDPKNADVLGGLLANRFAEVIVDEAQDCGPEELSILETLQTRGVEIVMVADLDQSIYEFRRSNPVEVRKFAQSLPQSPRLDGNFRSTKIICSINQSLRFSSDEDEALGSHAQLDYPIQIVSYADDDDVTSRVAAILSDHQLEAGDSMVISHKKVDAQAIAGASKFNDVGQSAVAQIAFASIILRSSADSRARYDAVESVETALLRLLGIDDKVGKPLDQLCAEHKMDRRWLRDLAVRMAFCANPLISSTGDYARDLRAFIGGIIWPEGRQVGNVSSIVKALPVQKWDVLSLSRSGSSLRWSSVHSVKGKEFASVVVVLPKKMVKCLEGKTALDHWESGSDAEVRRVLYVAVSRAQRLLMLAVHQSHVARVEELLEIGGVSFLRCEASVDKKKEIGRKVSPSTS